MFSKDVYTARRGALRTKMSGHDAEGSRGIVLFVGNAEAAAQYRDNAYNFRQDSSWLYFWGLDEPMMAATMDLDSGEECIYADDVEIGDIIWMGPQESVADKAARVGVYKSAPYNQLEADVTKALMSGRKVHFLPPSRYFNTMKLSTLLNLDYGQVLKVAPMGVDGGHHASEELVKAVVSLRLVKEACEIEELDKVAEIGYEMHSVARDGIIPGIIEQELVGRMEGVTLSKGWGVSFATILTQHGETLHNHLHDKVIEPGKLMVIDAGAESNSHYASDHTRTYPTGGHFTQKQKDVYQIVCDCNELAFSMVKPGVAYRDVHLAVEALMCERLKDSGLLRGEVSDMVENGIAGMFMPHGLGHNMGLDVHDMEDLGEDFVGYDPDQKRSPRLGLGSLRMARKLVEGNVITDEPGIYFIPALMDKWKSEGLGKDFICWDALDSYRDFGGIRLEDDVLVTPAGARRLGSRRLPILPDDVESAMNK